MLYNSGSAKCHSFLQAVVVVDAGRDDVGIGELITSRVQAIINKISGRVDKGDCRRTLTASNIQKHTDADDEHLGGRGDEILNR